MHNKILLLTLKTFSATGGIEKVCKVAGKALFENSLNGRQSFLLHSLYDQQSDADENIYFSADNFRGYRENKIKFIYQSVREGCLSNTVILSHINLLIVGCMIKFFSPKTKLVLLAHGIEIWGKLSWLKTRMLRCCDIFLPVSQYTSRRIQQEHEVPESRCVVVNNALDPFLPIVNEKEIKTDAESLRKKYGYTAEDKIIFTLTRLYSTERYKGYDKILESMQHIIKRNPTLRYLIAGKYDFEEKVFIESRAKELGLENHLKLTGFIPDDSVAAHFSMADLYVMPSRKEGFGIVFVEAMYYGLPVVAGNQDGSVDALLNGELGLLVDPLNIVEIENAIERILNDQKSFKPDRRILMNHFGYEGYKRRIDKVLTMRDELG
ncbi:MAG: glycosyltransferase family 4 protein, partial [Ferruginibacter sp.]|nr:glycosyltransferase family 4 protein [Ferruginibacter sp.]